MGFFKSTTGLVAFAAIASAQQFPNMTAGAGAMNTTNGNQPPCPPGFETCQVSDPTRPEQPWAGSQGPFPQCYSPDRYVCDFNFLCPIGTTKIPGQYACSVFGQNGTAAGNGTSAPSMLEMVVNAPSVGDFDGIMAQDFIVDLSINAMSQDANSAVPLMPLYQDMNSSTFGPGANAAFPGLVVLQNTTSSMIGGPNTNLAGVFQLNGIAQRANGLNQWNTVWQAGGPLFGVGPSELVVYYVSGQAGMNATYLPTSGLMSNVVRIPFNISNRTENAVPSEEPMCTNGAVYFPPTVGSSNSSMNSMNMSVPTVTGATNLKVPYPQMNDVVGRNGSGWMMSVAATATSNMYNQLLSAESNYTSGYTLPMTPSFGPGTNPYLPGMVVTLNTTMNMGPFMGPQTNLAALFQANVARVKNCDTLIQIYASWFVGMPIAGRGVPTRAVVYFIDGQAPAMVDSTTENMAISEAGVVDFMLSDAA